MEASRLVACLPFVHLKPNEAISIGPICFWSGSCYRDFVPEKQWTGFQAYLKRISCLHSREDSERDCPKDKSIPSEVLTFVSVHPSIVGQELNECLVDGLSLFYFTCFYRDLYYNVQVPPFQTFTKLAPALEKFTALDEKSQSFAIFEDQSQEPACIGLVDSNMAQALGHTLSAVYLSDMEGLARRSAYARRVVRSIRYFVNGFSTTFENIWRDGFSFPQCLFEPEDVIFLTSSFESLLNIESDQNTSDFKYRTRGIVQLEYSNAMEIFWAWTDGFFSLKYNMVYHGENPDTTFKVNPNFEVSYLYLGIRLFIFILHHKLCLHGFYPHSQGEKSLHDPLGKISREEVMVFFWPEKELLENIAQCLHRWTIPEAYEELRDITLFHMQLFCVLFHRYHLPRPREGHTAVNYYPTPKQLIEESTRAILDAGDLEIETDNGKLPIRAFTPEGFWTALKRRIDED